jgi:hypothetical protein
VQFKANRKDYEGNHLRMFDLAPEFAERLRAATRGSRPSATARLLSQALRSRLGAGRWRRLSQGSITAYGITDAFRDTELASAALDDAFSGRPPYSEAMAAWQHARDAESLPVYGLTCDFAKIQPPPAQMLQMLGAVSTSHDAVNGFVSVMAGTLPAPAFFAPENAARIIGTAQAAAPAWSPKARHAQAQVGHADAKVTLEIYAIVLKRRERRQFAAAFDALTQDAIPSMQRARMLTTGFEHLDNGTPGIPAVAA